MSKNSTNTSENDEYMKKEEIARYFKIGERTVNDWMRKGILPYTKVGGVVRFRIDECEAAVEPYKVRKLRVGTTRKLEYPSRTSATGTPPKADRMIA